MQQLPLSQALVMSLLPLSLELMMTTSTTTTTALAKTMYVPLLMTLSLI